MKYLCESCSVDVVLSLPTDKSYCAARYLADNVFHPWRSPEPKRLLMVERLIY